MKILQYPKKHPAQHLLGSFCDQSHYDTLIVEDTDCYGPSTGTNSEANIILKLRKQAFSRMDERLAYEGLKAAAAPSENRGQAAGPINDGRDSRDWVRAQELDMLYRLSRQEETDRQAIDQPQQELPQLRGYVWLRRKIITDQGSYDGWWERWLRAIADQSPEAQKRAADYVRGTYISNTTYAQRATSGIVGYFDRYPRIPYGRATRYTTKHPGQYAKCFPYVRRLDAIFKRELPERWQRQRDAADCIDPRFLICGSIFSTLTVNHNWRTAAHRDAGDLRDGFSSIAAFAGPDQTGWRGGELILPEYRLAVRLEPRDLLLVNAHQCIHANAPLIGDHNDRLTIVAYFREGMLDLGSWEYETLRKQFADEHGVTPNMWQSKAWADHLTENKMIDEDAVVEQ